MPFLFEKNIGEGCAGDLVPNRPGNLRIHVGYVTLSSGTATYTVPELVSAPVTFSAGAFIAYVGGALSNTGALSGSLVNGVFTVTSTNALDANIVAFAILY